MKTSTLSLCIINIILIIISRDWPLRVNIINIIIILFGLGQYHIIVIFIWSTSFLLVFKWSLFSAVITLIHGKLMFPDGSIYIDIFIQDILRKRLTSHKALFNGTRVILLGLEIHVFRPYQTGLSNENW